MAITGYSTIVAALGTLLVLVGVVLIRLGHWPRRTGASIHCAICDYILTGAEARCPECGTVVGERTVVRGRRRRKPGLTGSGVGLALLGLTILGLYVTALTGTVDWNRYKPLGWLLRDLDAPAAAGPAWAEIRRRQGDGALSEADQNALLEKALQVQAAAGAAPPVLPALLDLVAGRYLDHKLTDAQAERFFAGAMKVSLTVRPIVGSQSRLPYSILSNGRGPSGWWLRAKSIEAQVDNGPVQKQGGASGGPFGGWSSSMLLPAVNSPGKHRLRVLVEMATDPNQAAIWNDNAPAARREQKDLFADFDVIDGQTPIETRSTPDPAALAARLTPRLSFDPASRRLDVTLDADALPVDAAFDVFARFNGRDYRLGGVNFHKNVASGYSTGGTDTPGDPPAKVDLILRSSEAVARETVDLTRVWKGQILLPGVEVLRPATAPTNSSLTVVPTSAARRDLGKGTPVTPARDPSGR